METKFECNRFKGIWPVSGRDFCMLAHTMRDSNGRIIISAFSHEHEGCPPVKKYVRAELI